MLVLPVYTLFFQLEASSCIKKYREGSSLSIPYLLSMKGANPGMISPTAVPLVLVPRKRYKFMTGIVHSTGTEVFSLLFG